MKTLLAFRVVPFLFCSAFLLCVSNADAAPKKDKANGHSWQTEHKYPGGNDWQSESNKYPGQGWQSGKPGPHKLTICHIPPGNPANAHNITVGQRAALRHIRIHGDTLSCPTCACPPVPTCDKCSGSNCPTHCSSSSSSKGHCSSSSSCNSSSSESSCSSSSACAAQTCLSECYDMCALDCGVDPS